MKIKFKNIYLQNNYDNCIIEFKNFYKEIEQIDDRNIPINDDINLYIKLPNYYYIRTYDKVENMTFKLLMKYIYETAERAIKYDIENYPLSYSKRISEKKVLYQCYIISSSQYSDIKMNKNNIYVNLQYK